MIIIENTLVSDELLEKQFVCNLDKCKGACCIAGDSGAPLEEKETRALESIYPEIKDYLTPQGRETLEQIGRWMVDTDGDFVTPLVNGNKECAYTIFENGIALCGIEKAYRDGKTTFRKPISCYLYPVRIKKTREYEALNYDRWDICSPACKSGKELGVPVYQFVKNALLEKYGAEWFKQLEGAAAFKEAGKAAGR